VKLTGGAITGTGVNGILTSATAYDLQSGSSSAVLAGTAGATKTTAGTVTLTKANTYSGGTALSDGTLQLGNNTALGTGTVALNGGTLSSDDTANRTILNAVTVGGNVVLGDATNDGKLNFSAGVDLGAGDRTLTTASSVAFNGAVSGSGGITKAGSATLTLSTTNSYLGNTVLVQGSLIINGNQSSATGALTVASGATLGGSGTIGGATTISGIHSPGNSPGVQTFNNGLTYSNGSTFVWELITNGSADRGTAFDGVNVSGGTLTINGGVTNNLVFNGAGSTVNWSDTFWASNQQWLVFDNASFPTVSSNVFDTINVGVDSISQSLTSVRSGSSFSWDTIDDNLYLTYAIPEPSTCALLALLGAGFAGRALVRRRRRHEVN
jgi:autotransporter-associated beta strand protein